MYTTFGLRNIYKFIYKLLVFENVAVADNAVRLREVAPSANEESNVDGENMV